MLSQPEPPPPDNAGEDRRPLLAQNHRQAEAEALHDATHEVIYHCFSPFQKRTIVAIVSVDGLLPLFVLVSLAVSLSILATALGYSTVRDN